MEAVFFICRKKTGPFSGRPLTARLHTKAAPVRVPPGTFH
ncbi:hypothetical protein HMPREF0080_00865 [Anaeroglobus geminatus F0357]|uniref:Uncharacterized protein n=1 Tax=Anaeroglobus geminatus F0357 TaxID=861450 RepID=G9YGU5_9FIRM|nr:hypothetical protein HMPREF0080_00865 [Anaeroglobus geminatus F0357]